MKTHTLVSAKILILMLVIAAVLNGSASYLQRIGVFNSDGFHDLLKQKQHFIDVEKQYIENPGAFTQTEVDYYVNWYRQFRSDKKNHIYALSDKAIFTKVFKFFTIFLIILYSFIYTITHRATKNYQTTVLLILIAVNSLMCLFVYGWVATLAGYYCYSFLLVTFFSTPLIKSTQFSFLSKTFFMSVLLLIPMSYFELRYGLQIFNQELFFNKRIIGFMSQPNTLGVYLICILSLYHANLEITLNKFVYSLTIILVTILVILAGSNTAMIGLLVWLTFSIFKLHRENKFDYFYLVLVLLVALAFFLTEGRPALDSLFGRIQKYSYYFSLDFSSIKLLTGQGIGIGSNILLQLSNHYNTEFNSPIPVGFSTDSTPLLLIIQIGIIGCILLYGLIIYAMVHDPKLRPVYLIFILCSLTINIIELFPLNIILGLMLAKSFSEQNLAKTDNTDYANAT